MFEASNGMALFENIVHPKKYDHVLQVSVGNEFEVEQTVTAKQQRETWQKQKILTHQSQKTYCGMILRKRINVIAPKTRLVKISNPVNPGPHPI